MSGFQIPGGGPILGPAAGDGFQAFAPLKKIQARQGNELVFIAQEGSLSTRRGIDEVSLLVRSYFDTRDVRKVAMYGYSAGANNLLEICRLLDKDNAARKTRGANIVSVDLLVTVDAACRPSDKNCPLFCPVDRTLSGVVAFNKNWYQTSPSLVGGACGGPNSPVASSVTGKTARHEGIDMTSQLGLNLPGASKHQEIEGKTLSEAVNLISKELA